MTFVIRGFNGVARFANAQISLLVATLLFGSLPLWAAQPEKVLRIGFIGNSSIPLVATIQSGFEAAMAGAGFKEGVNVFYDRQNPEGDPAKTQAIARKFADGKLDLIHSFGTPATLAVMKDAPNIPLVFSAVGDPVKVGVVPESSSVGKVTGTRVTGVSDLWPVRLQMETYAKVYPKAKKWGTIYNPAEANSPYNITALRESARKLGLELVEVSVANRHEIRPAAASLVGKVQAVYIPSGGTVVTEIATVAEIFAKNNIAFFSGTTSSLSQGALAAYGIDYFMVGYAAGKKASLVLKGIDPGSIPWDRGGNFGLIVNQKAAKHLGIVIPAEMLRIADKVIE